MGITLGRIGMALLGYVEQTEVDDIGKYLAQAGMTANRAGPSTMGTLFSTALMRAGKAVRGKTELSADDLAQMFQAADEGVAERGKANLGDKTIRDALNPAAAAFAAAIADGKSLAEAGAAALAASEAGRDRVTPQRSKVGRAGWVGERTEGQIDPAARCSCCCCANWRASDVFARVSVIHEQALAAENRRTDGQDASLRSTRRSAHLASKLIRITCTGSSELRGGRC